ncbi:hypothetical protein EBQ81_00870 [bacterium]|nr:hypothetical protein [bacterium]
MGTRSLIGVEQGDGSVVWAYCHWDGYLSHNGRRLLDHYQDPYKAWALVIGGDMSSLGEEIGEKHPFDWQLEKWNKTRVGFGSYDDSRLTDEEKAQYDLWSKWTSYYGRDRGETDIDAKLAANAEAFFAEDYGAEYWYLMTRDGEWLVKIGDGAEPITLKSAWAQEQAEEEAAKLQDHAEDLSIIP